MITKFNTVADIANSITFNSNIRERENNIGDDLMEILENGSIKTMFQPIVSLKDGEILGFEALSRGPRGSSLENPSVLFDTARVYGKLWELEFLCRIKALENASKVGTPFNIFLNVDPHIIHDEKFKKGFTKEFLKQFNINPENIIFEITEKNAVTDMESFKKVISNYRDQGYKIAIDDTGSGYSGLKLITEIHPQYIKLDMNLIRDIDKDGLKYALIKTFYDFCLVTDIKLIAEGIETQNELNTLIDIGIHYGQGYLIQRPSSEIGEINPEILSFIKNRNSRKSILYLSRPSTIPVGDIARQAFTVLPTSIGSNILDIFNNHSSLFGLPVVFNGKLHGLIMKDKFYSKLGTQYGFALFLNRPVTLIMEKHPLAVDYETTIDVVSKQAMNRADDTLYDYIIVLKDSQYHGIVTVKDLLEKTTELEVNYAKHLNPLSGLPGNILIEHKLKEYLSSPIASTVLYLDIDNFKVYNDVYGFENGDRVIQFVARILNDTLSTQSCYPYFVGHIGGDDYVVIVENCSVNDLCESILKNFEKGKYDFYSSEDITRNYIYAKNRRGEEEQFGLISLSIAGVKNLQKRFANIYDLTEYASKIKKKCKQDWFSCYYVD